MVCACETIHLFSIVFCVVGAVRVSACETIHLFSVVFCVVRAVRVSDCRLVINETPDKWRRVERRSRSDRDSCF